MSPIQENKSELNASSGNCFILMPVGGNIGAPISSVILLLNFLVGFPMNFWVVWLICRGTTKTLSSELHHLSLAVSDLTFCLVLPAQLFFIYAPEDVQRHTTELISQPYATFFSVLLKLLAGMVWMARPIFQCCICWERYMAVVHPQLYLRLKPLKYKLTQCLLCWCIYAEMIVIKIFDESSEYELVFLVPALCIFLYCYVAVLISLRRPRPGDREQGQKTSGDKLKIKAIKIILVNLVFFVVNYLPNTAIFYINECNNVTLALFQVFGSVGVSCGLIQPLLYLHKSGKLYSFNKALPK